MYSTKVFRSDLISEDIWPDCRYKTCLWPRGSSTQNSPAKIENIGPISEDSKQTAIILARRPSQDVSYSCITSQQADSQTPSHLLCHHLMRFGHSYRPCWSQYLNSGWKPEMQKSRAQKPAHRFSKHDSTQKPQNVCNVCRSAVTRAEDSALVRHRQY